MAGSPSLAEGSLLGRGRRVAWFVLWATMAGLMLAAPASASSLTASGGTKAAVVTIGFAAFALAAVGLLIPVTTRPALVLAVIAALALWVAGEDFGGIFSGSGTDPNTGPTAGNPNGRRPARPPA